MKMQNKRITQYQSAAVSIYIMASRLSESIDISAGRGNIRYKLNYRILRI